MRKIENMKKIHRRKVCHNHAKKDDGRKKRFEWLPRILSLSESDAFKEDGSVSLVSLSVSPSVSQGRLSFEGGHASAHDLVDEEEVGGDDGARVEKLHFHSACTRKNGREKREFKTR